MQAPPNWTTTTSPNTTTTLNTTNQSGGTTVTFTIDPAYTVTIPGTIELDKITDTTNTTVTYEKDLTLTASNVRLEKGKKLQVSIDKIKSTFQLSAGTAKLDYTINNTKPDTIDVVAIFGTSTTDQSVTLHIKAGNPEFAGAYTGTLNFTIEVI